MEDIKVSVGARLQAIMSERNLRAVDLHELIKPYCKKYGITISKSQLSQYINDFNEPGQRRLFILAQALDISEAWLLGFDVPKKESHSPPQPTSERKNFLCCFQKCQRISKLLLFRQ